MRADQVLPLLFLFVCSNLALTQDLAVRPETRFPAELAHTLKSSSAKVGDHVMFRTLRSVLIGNGVVVPQGAELRGEVVEVREQETDGEPAVLRLRMDTLVYKHRELPTNLVVASVFNSRSAVADSYDAGRMNVTFLEGIQITAHLSDEASTSFTGHNRNVVLHSGILLEFRQVDPQNSQLDRLAATH